MIRAHEGEILQNTFRNIPSNKAQRQILTIERERERETLTKERGREEKGKTSDRKR